MTSGPTIPFPCGVVGRPRVHAPQPEGRASRLSVGSDHLSSWSPGVHLTASALFRARPRWVGIRPVIHDDQLEDWPGCRGFPLPFGHRHSLLGHPVPAPPSAFLTVGLPNPEQGLGAGRGCHVPHTRDATGMGALCTPGTTVLTPSRSDSPAGVCRLLKRPVPVSRHQQPITREFASRGINKGSRNSPARSSPRLWPPGWKRAALGLYPELRTQRLLATHVEVGTGQQSTCPELPLNSHRSISNPVVHSMCATSRRTSQSARPDAGHPPRESERPICAR
jgi:hypothetical protein